MGGIYIKGMEMPKNCFDCPLFDDVYTDADGDDDYCCGLGVPLDYYQASGEVIKSCPLVLVPEHGRLIDADTLNYTMLYKENWMSGTGVEALAVWKKDIDASQTIIPASEEKMK